MEQNTACSFLLCIKTNLIEHIGEPSLRRLDYFNENSLEFSKKKILSVIVDFLSQDDSKAIAICIISNLTLSGIELSARHWEKILNDLESCINYSSTSTQKTINVRNASLSLLVTASSSQEAYFVLETSCRAEHIYCGSEPFELDSKVATFLMSPYVMNQFNSFTNSGYTLPPTVLSIPDFGHVNIRGWTCFNHTIAVHEARLKPTCNRDVLDLCNIVFQQAKHGDIREFHDNFNINPFSHYIAEEDEEEDNEHDDCGFVESKKTAPHYSEFQQVHRLVWDRVFPWHYVPKEVGEEVAKELVSQYLNPRSVWCSCLWSSYSALGEMEMHPTFFHLTEKQRQSVRQCVSMVSSCTSIRYTPIPGIDVIHHAPLWD